MNDKNKKITIIISNYKNGQALEKSIKYILNQSIKNIELLIVNNNTKSNCDDIIKKYLELDRRIKYINYEDNISLFQARLKGADCATGDYIAFLDGEEYPSIDYYRNMLNNAIVNNSDIVIGNTVLECTDKSKNEYPLLKINFKQINKEEIMNNYFEQRGYNYNWYILWNKICSINIWKKARIFLNEIEKKIETYECEDIVISTILLYFSKKITKIDNDCIFSWESKVLPEDTNKLDFDKEKRNIKDLITSFTFIEKFMKKMKKFDKYKEYFYDWKKNISTMHNEIIDRNENFTIELKQELKEYLKKFCEKTNKQNNIDYFFSIKTPYDERLDNIKMQIIDPNIRCISFDIFDTLITRPFYLPSDLFRMLDLFFIENSGNHSINFSKIRVESEKIAREKKETIDKEDVTLDEIYDTIREIYELDKEILSKMKEKEIEKEIEFCQVRATAHEFYELALAMNKKVICVSDMYLPKKVILKMIKKCGYNIKDIYLSSEILKTKSSGKLFEYMLEKEKFKPEEIIHIGDNYNSDYLNPQSKGMKAIYFLKATDCYYYANNMEKMLTVSLPFWQDNRNSMQFIGVRTMLAIVANKYFDNPYRSFNSESDFNADPYLIGYYALGMYNYAITRWLLDNTNGKYDTLCFVARDGYLSMKTFEILKELYKNPPKSVYMYMSRKSLIPILIKEKFDFYKLTDLFHTTNSNPKKITKYLKNNMEIDEKKLEEKCTKSNIKYNQNFKNNEEFNKFLTLVANSFYNEKKQIEVREKLKKYFNNIFGNKNAIFDVGYSGRPEYYLSTFLNKKIDAFFLNINCDEALEYSKIGNFKINTFFSAKPTLTGNAYEMLISKLDASCIGYDTTKEIVTPIFEKYEENYPSNHIINVMQKAAIEFTKDLYTIFKKDINMLYYQDYYLSLPIMAYFNSSEKIDKSILKSVIFEDDTGFGIDRKMIDDMEKEAKIKNQKKLKELFETEDTTKEIVPEEKKINERINNTEYNIMDLSKYGKIKRLTYYILFDRVTLKRKIKNIKKRKNE